ncbi:MAG: RNA polymerase subunit sigma-24 [Myxococcales bacterium]|nr:RNA polymerase subunit sigma-24 [Myxococcales bacterium]
MSDSPVDEDVYALLRSLARRIHAERGGGRHSLQPTELLHEAWARIADGRARYRSREHFVALAARAMRHVLVDRARARLADKRGGGAVPTTLRAVGVSDDPVDLLAVDQALTELEANDARAAEVVQLRVFGGLTVEEVAAHLGLGERTVYDSWRFGRAFLVLRLGA